MAAAQTELLKRAKVGLLAAWPLTLFSLGLPLWTFLYERSHGRSGSEARSGGAETACVLL